MDKHKVYEVWRNFGEPNEPKHDLKRIVAPSEKRAIQIYCEAIHFDLNGWHLVAREVKFTLDKVLV